MAPQLSRQRSLLSLLLITLLTCGLLPASPVTPAAAATAQSSLVAVTPARLLDTRSGQSTVDGQSAGTGALAARSSRAVTVLGRGGVPSVGVSAVVVNVTGTRPSAGTFLTAYPTGAAVPGASTLNLKTGETAANLAVVKVGTGGQISLYNEAAPTDVVLDIMGYYRTASPYTPLVPGRIMDTRTSGGSSTVDGRSQGTGAIGAGSTRDLPVAGRAGVPATGAATVILNVTVLARAHTFVTVFPGGGTRPAASNVNVAAGAIVPNLVVVPLGSAGTVSLFNDSGATDLVVDVVGWSAADPTVQALAGRRLLDTRPGESTVDGRSVGSGPVKGGATITVPLAGRGDIPADAKGVYANLTGVSPTRGTFLTAYPAGAARPNASSLNLGLTRANLTFLPLGADGAVTLYNAVGSVDLVLDVVGYTTVPPPLVLSTSTLPDASTAVAYSASLSATGGERPYTFQATGLPPGLALSSGGTLSGEPTKAGSYTPVVTVTDASGDTATRTLALKVTVYAGADPTLATRIGNLLQDQRVVNGTSGTVVADSRNALDLYTRNATALVKPASNMKVLTSTAALGVLGPDCRFKTSVFEQVAPSNGVVDGDLYLKGYGDPTLRESDLVALAADLKATGVTQVTGRLVADDTFFDQDTFNDHWNPAWFPERYAPEIEALTISPDSDYDLANVIVRYSGTTTGQPAQLTLVPASAAGYVTIVNKTTTGSAGASDTVYADRSTATGNTIVVSGTVAPGASGKDSTTVHDPSRYTLHVFRKALAAQGITVAGGDVDGTVPASAVRAATDTSMTLGELMVPFLKLSNNGHAEHLVKTMGAVAGSGGTWPSGLAVMKGWLTNHDVPMDGLTIVDGSGLSHDNRINARTMIRALLMAADQSWFATWYQALPIAGNTDRMKGGTLRGRMIGTPAADNFHGKTGTLSGVTALSGYVTGADGRPYVMSMISNYLGNTPRPVEDQLVVLLAGWTASP